MEPESLSEAYDDLLADGEETLQWAQGKTNLRMTTVSDEAHNGIANGKALIKKSIER